MTFRWFVVLGVLATAGARADDSPPGGLRLVWLDGREETAAGIAFADESQLTLADGRSISLGELRRLEPLTPAAETADSPTIEIRLRQGGLLKSVALELRDDVCTVSRSKETGNLSIDDVRSICFVPPSDSIASFLAQPPGEKDRLAVQVDSATTAVEGFVERIDADAVTFDWMGKPRSLPRGKLQAVVFSAVGPAADAQPRFMMELGDGSRVPAKGFMVDADSSALRIAISASTSLEFPLGDVRSVRIRSERLQFLSDLTPAVVDERPVIALARRWQADRSVTGGPLMAGDQRFDKGLGVQSGSSLTYDLAEGWSNFAAVLAIDPSASGGDCVFVVKGDDRELVRERVRSREPPRNVRTDVSGVRKLLLAVEYGEDLDFGDRANWCDAHLVRAPDASSRSSTAQQ